MCIRLSNHPTVFRSDMAKEVDSIVQEFMGNRDAKERLSPEAYSMYSKPLGLGWKRECFVGRGRKIVLVDYVSSQGNRCANWDQIEEERQGHQILDLLDDQQVEDDQELTREHFNFKKEFLGFAEESEIVTLTNFFTDKIEDQKTPNKAPPLGKFVLVNGKDKRIQCIHPKCVRRLSNTAKSHVNHVLQHHTEEEKCDGCGVRRNPVSMKKHLTKCKKRTSLKNDIRKTSNKKDDRKTSDKNDVRRTSDGTLRGKRKRSNSEKSIGSSDSDTDSSSVPLNNNVKRRKEEEPTSNLPGPDTKVDFIIKIDQQDGENVREIHIRTRRSAKVLKLNTLKRFKIEEGYDSVDTAWECDGKILGPEVTGESLEGKVISLKVL